MHQAQHPPIELRRGENQLTRELLVPHRHRRTEKYNAGDGQQDSRRNPMGCQDLTLFGRLSTQAPEIDGVVYLSETEAQPGEFVDVTVTDVT